MKYPLGSLRLAASPDGYPALVRKDGLRLELGRAEIRVFGDRGKIYASPNMLFHYVTAHHYKPPDEFIQALKHGPCPPDKEYFDRLESIGLEWAKTRRCKLAARKRVEPLISLSPVQGRPAEKLKGTEPKRKSV